METFRAINRGPDRVRPRFFLNRLPQRRTLSVIRARSRLNAPESGATSPAKPAAKSTPNSDSTSPAEEVGSPQVSQPATRKHSPPNPVSEQTSTRAASKRKVVKKAKHISAPAAPKVSSKKTTKPSPNRWEMLDKFRKLP